MSEPRRRIRPTPGQASPMQQQAAVPAASAGVIQPQTQAGPAIQAQGQVGQGRAAAGAAGINAGGNGSAGARVAGQGVSWMKRGQAAAATRQTEATAAQERRERAQAGLYMPFRFRLDWKDPTKSSAEVVLLDHEPGPCFFEHDLSFEQRVPREKGGVFLTCPKETEPCPCCMAFKESYYVMMLTMVDLRPYRKQDGTVVRFRRKLLPIKAHQQPQFLRLFERYNTLRGLHLLMTRDSQTQAQIGQPELVRPEGPYPEDALVQSFGGPEVRSTQDPARVVKAANADAFPFPYEQLFEPPSAERMRAKLGAALGQYGQAPAGSTAANRQDWGQQDWGLPAASPIQGGAIQAQGGHAGPITAVRSGGGAEPQGFDDLDDEIPF